MLCYATVSKSHWLMPNSYFLQRSANTDMPVRLCSKLQPSLVYWCSQLLFPENWLKMSPHSPIQKFQFSSVQFSRSVMSHSLRPHESQHARPPCPSPTPGVHSDSCPSSQWHHPAISSSVVPFSSCPQSLPASGSFPMSQLFAWDGQKTGVSALASVFPKSRTYLL